MYFKRIPIFTLKRIIIKLTLLLFTVVVIYSCSHTYYIVRHAEKIKTLGENIIAKGTDPELSKTGKMRAQKLKEILLNKKIKYIFSTNTIRTMTTAKPLSDAIGVNTALYNLGEMLILLHN